MSALIKEFICTLLNIYIFLVQCLNTPKQSGCWLMCSCPPTLTMVSHISLANKSACRTQPPKRPRTKVILSSEAWRMLKLDQQEKTEQFHKDLNEAWERLDEVTKTLATKHGKSIHRVQNELYLGHAKFCSRRKKVNTWNAFCWKKHRSANDKNSMCF